MTSDGDYFISITDLLDRYVLPKTMRFIKVQCKSELLANLITIPLFHFGLTDIMSFFWVVVYLTVSLYGAGK
jgi:hypothetical protein